MAPPTKSILLVEDDAETRTAIGDALKRFGYQVLPAADGRDALAVLRREPVRPTLILLDWMMPVLDGLGFLSAQASDPRYGLIPVVVLSELGRMERIPSLCVAAVLTKPVRMRTLLEVVDRLCEIPPRTELVERRSSRAVTYVGVDRRRGAERGTTASNHDGNTAIMRRARVLPD